jgi:hypothetical protein
VEDAEEEGGGFLVARCDRAPLLEPRPQVFHKAKAGIGSVRVGDGRRLSRACTARWTPMLQMCSRKAWLERPRSATTQSGTPGGRASSGTACGSSCACHGASAKATTRPAPSAITHAFVLKPPREWPSAPALPRGPEVEASGVLFSLRRLPPSGRRGSQFRRGRPC